MYRTFKLLNKFKLYSSYVIKHKWYVFLECYKLGIPRQGITHDLSKLIPDEFFPYASHFYGYNKRIESKSGYFKKVDSGDKAFDAAWFKHIKRNKHHWQYWLLADENGKIKSVEMPIRFRKEMVADWKGAAKAQGNPSVFAWYDKYKHKMHLGAETQRWIEKELNKI